MNTTFQAEEERLRLADVAARANYHLGANAATIRYAASVLARFWDTSGSCLELGPADGTMTALLADRFADLTCVDASAQFCEQLRGKFPRAQIIETLFEDFRPARKYKNVILTHVLEHVADPVETLRGVREWVADDGVVLACVPHAHSIHRQMAVVMGMLQEENELNATDLGIGHRRVYDRMSLRRDFRRAGFRIEAEGGYWLKPVSNAQIEANWNEAMLAAAMTVGERYPDIAAEIYVVARV
jgi:2-polyprenyl-3-methyl-5-hydroxy-6-metoxy-1,4-benzoquinol methylase